MFLTQERVVKQMFQTYDLFISQTKPGGSASPKIFIALLISTFKILNNQTSLFINL